MNEQQERVDGSEQDEACWLMSLALDRMLAGEEERRLDSLMDGEPALAQEWATWQWLDQELCATPRVEAPDGFLARFELRLALQERQRRLRLGIAVAVTSVLMLGSAMAAVAVLAALFLGSQAAWASTVVERGLLWGSAFAAWLEVWWKSAAVVLSMPEAQVGAVCYILLSIAILMLWMQFLRRSTQVSAETATA